MEVTYSIVAIRQQRVLESNHQHIEAQHRFNLNLIQSFSGEFGLLATANIESILTTLFSWVFAMTAQGSFPKRGS